MASTEKRRDLPVFPLSPDPIRPEVGLDAHVVRLELEVVDAGEHDLVARLVV